MYVHVLVYSSFLSQMTNEQRFILKIKYTAYIYIPYVYLFLNYYPSCFIYIYRFVL